MPPRSKKTVPHQHKRIHENGLAAPGRRIEKQKSTGNLNGAAGHHVKDAVTSHPSATDALHPSSASSPPPAHLPASTDDPITYTDTRASDRTGQEERYLSISGASSTDESESVSNGCTPPELAAAATAAVSMPDTRSTPASLSFEPRRQHPLLTATTIVQACPLRDVLAILILLLQLPPFVLTMVQCLFTALTVVPPAMGHSLSQLPSLEELLQYPGGRPTIGVVLVTDVIVFAFWLLFPFRIQSAVLDLAQAIIAVSLGGATAGRRADSSAIAVGISLILFSHLLRWNAARLYFIRLISHAVGLLDLTFPTILEGFIPQAPPTGRHGLIRTAVSLHIVAQAGVRYLMRSLQQQDSTSTTKDSDAGIGARKQSGSQSHSSSLSLPGLNNGRLPTSPVLWKDSDQRKRRKRLAHQVRGQQPFWAALASTKVAYLKEMEQQHAFNDYHETVAAGVDGGGVTRQQKDSGFWPGEVGPTCISINARIPPDFEQGYLANGTENRNANDAHLPPFWIRINGAEWTSTNCWQNPADECLWTIRAFGLVPLSTYHLDVMGRKSNHVFESLDVITAEPSLPDHVTASLTTKPSNLRPASPITTLKNSVVSADDQLSELRNEQKRQRKEHARSANHIRKEGDTLNNKLSSSNTNDERQRQRTLQLSKNITSSEDAIIQTEVDIENVGDVPDETRKQLRTHKDQWSKVKSTKEAADETFNRLKKETSRDSKQLQDTLSSTRQKRERQSTRLQKARETRERLRAEGNNATHYVQARNSWRVGQVESWRQEEQNFRAWIGQTNAQSQMFEQRAAAVSSGYQQPDAMELQQNGIHMSGPATPAEPSVSAHFGPVGSRLMGLGSTTSNPVASNQMSNNAWQRSGSGGGSSNRQRASSLLSNTSGYTDDLDLPSQSRQQQQQNDSPNSPARNNSDSSAGEFLPKMNGTGPGPISPPHSYHVATSSAV